MNSKNIVGIPDIVYHGTRCSLNLIEKFGLIFDYSFILLKMKEFSDKINVNIYDWKESNNIYYYNDNGKRLYNLITSVNDRCRIWVTSNYYNAVNYSKYNPEILYDIFSSMYRYKFFKRHGNNFENELNDFILKELQNIGMRKVIFIDNYNELINCSFGNNRICKSKYVPINAIIKIKNIEENEYYNLMINNDGGMNND